MGQMIRFGRDKIVTQRDIEQLYILRQEAEAAREAYHRKRQEIYGALESGAKVQPGAHRARLRALLVFR